MTKAPRRRDAASAGSGKSFSPTDRYHSLDAFPADYLARNQHEPERAAKILTKAHERRLARKERQRNRAESAGLLRPIFQIDLRKANDGKV